MNETSLTVAVFGACSRQGAEVVTALEGEGLPVGRFIITDSGQGAATEVFWRGAKLTATPMGRVDLGALDVAICATSDAIAEELCPRLLAEDVFTLDLSPGACPRGLLPPVWPTLNPEALNDHPGGLAIPDPMAAALCELLAAIHTVGRPERITATVLQGAGQVGREGVEALSAQTVALLSQRQPERGALRSVLAFNLIPGSHDADEGGDPYERNSVATIRALGLPYLDEVRLTTVQVPIFSGTAAAVIVDINDPLPSEEDLQGAIDARSELVRVGVEGTLRDAQEIDQVLISSLRRDADGSLRCLVLTDDQHRRANVTASILSRVVQDDLW